MIRDNWLIPIAKLLSLDLSDILNHKWQDYPNFIIFSFLWLSIDWGLVFETERKCEASVTLNVTSIVWSKCKRVRRALTRPNCELVCIMQQSIKRQFFSMSRICNEKCSKPKIFLAFLSKFLNASAGWAGNIK
jgi:hypothetical protein